jgi:tight adherence protein C
LSKEVIYAGSPVGWDAERILATKVMTTIGGVVGAFAFAKYVVNFHSIRAGIVILLGGYVGWYLPEWILRSRSGKRQGAMRRSLPDALDLLSITVEAGLGFDAAVARVARQEGGPLGEELHRVLQEMQLGKSRADSLRDLGERTSIPEFKTFVLAMIQADIFGISIAKVLHVQAAEMRTKRRQRAEEKAQKVPVKIVFPLLTCIFPSLFVVLLGPAMISIYNAFKHIKK